jgi:hypothetical protein
MTGRGGSGGDPEDRLRALKQEFGRDGAAKQAKGFGSSGTSSSGGGESSSTPSGPVIGNAEALLTEADRKWRLSAAEVGEWEAWLEAQKEFAALPAGKRNCWVQVQLDGTVRSSGVGAPPWGRFIGDLPELDSLRTKMTDGIGPSI